MCVKHEKETTRTTCIQPMMNCFQNGDHLLDNNSMLPSYLLFLQFVLMIVLSKNVDRWHIYLSHHMSLNILHVVAWYTARHLVAATKPNHNLKTNTQEGMNMNLGLIFFRKRLCIILERTVEHCAVILCNYCLIKDCQILKTLLVNNLGVKRL